MSEQAIYFYTRHPISAAIILAKLRDARGHLDGVRPDELFAHDQDHYGGLAANDALAAAARIGTGSRVADFCAGLGGPARYLAHRYGADVTGIELTPARVAGAAEARPRSSGCRIACACSRHPWRAAARCRQERGEPGSLRLHVPDKRQGVGVRARLTAF